MTPGPRYRSARAKSGLPVAAPRWPRRCLRRASRAVAEAGSAWHAPARGPALSDGPGAPDSDPPRRPRRLGHDAPGRVAARQRRFAAAGNLNPSRGRPGPASGAGPLAPTRPGTGSESARVAAAHPPCHTHAHAGGCYGVPSNKPRPADSERPGGPSPSPIRITCSFCAFQVARRRTGSVAPHDVRVANTETRCSHPSRCSVFVFSLSIVHASAWHTALLEARSADGDVELGTSNHLKQWTHLIRHGGRPDFESESAMRRAEESPAK